MNIIKRGNHLIAIDKVEAGLIYYRQWVKYKYIGAWVDSDLDFYEKIKIKKGQKLLQINEVKREHEPYYIGSKSTNRLKNGKELELIDKLIFGSK